MERMASLLIGEVSKRTGVSTPTIRYYEGIGLLPSPPRSGAGYRRYHDATVEELLFIRKAQGLGFSLDEIAQILQLSRSGKAPCLHVLSLARKHLATVDEQVRQLRAFRRQLADDLAKWDAQCAAVTCTGLCRFITEAEPAATPVNFSQAPRRHDKRRQTGPDGHPRK